MKSSTLSNLGSLLLVNDDEIKVRNPYRDQVFVCKKVLNMGLLSKLKSLINMRNQHDAQVRKKSYPELHLAPKDFTLMKCSCYREMDLQISNHEIDYVSGGQTMNLSTEDIAKAIEQVGYQNVIILPNK